MKVLVIIIACLLLLLLIIICAKLTILIEYEHVQDDDNLKIMFKVLMFRYTINVPFIAVDKEKASVVVETESNKHAEKKRITPHVVIRELKKFRRWILHINHLHTIIKKFLAHVYMTKLNWHTAVGLNDASTTGMVVGIGWAVKYNIIGFLDRYIQLQNMPTIVMTPLFQQAVLQTRLVCMIQFRIGYAIVAGIKILFFWRNTRRIMNEEEEQ